MADERVAKLLGAVEVKDDTSNDRLQVKAPSAMAADGVAVQVHDKAASTSGAASATVLGATNDAAKDGDQDGTVNAHTRGIAKTLGSTADNAVSADAVGSISGKLRGVVTHLLALAGVTGTTADAAVVTDGDGTVSAKLRGLIKLLVDKITVKLDAGENLVGRVTGYTARVVAATFQRPNDTTPYAANDVISTGAGQLIEFTVARNNGGSGMVLAAGVNVASNPATQPNLALILFETAPASFADNATLALSDADALKCLGTYQLTNRQIMNTGADATGFTRFSSDIVPRAFTCANDSKKIYGILVSTSAHTPVAQIDYTPFVHVAE